MAKGALAPCPPSIITRILKWWARQRADIRATVGFATLRVCFETESNYHLVIARSPCDEAIQLFFFDGAWEKWIASLRSQ
mgnify:CR=1